MIVIPAIDLFGGNVVRLEKGDLNRAHVYSRDPLETAKKFVASGATVIHIVDLDAAIRGDADQNKLVIDLLLGQIVHATCLQIAGGIRQVETARRLIDRGAKRIVIGSVAYSSPEISLEILNSLGSEAVVLALDYDLRGRVKTMGWKTEQVETALDAVARFSKLGFRNFLLTAIERDGMMEGPDVENLEIFKKSLGDSGKIIASGGVSNVDDLADLERIKVDEAIIGKGLYEEKMSLSVFRRSESILASR
jgi:phosphoribosylformimino-5-aminoimidazole carboxamide ribotide isomerase